MYKVLKQERSPSRQAVSEIISIYTMRLTMHITWSVEYTGHVHAAGRILVALLDGGSRTARHTILLDAIIFSRNLSAAIFCLAFPSV